MALRRTKILVMAISMLLGAAVLIPAGSASATQKAIAKIGYKNTFFFNSYYFGYRTGTAIVTVGSTPGTPSIMWDASVISGGTSGYTYSGAMTPSATRTSMFVNKAAQLSKSWSGALNGATTAGTTAAPVGAQPTSICFNGATPPGPTHVGACVTRPGVLKVAPGPKLFGGSAKLIAPLTAMGLFNAQSPATGYDIFSIMGATTAMVASDSPSPIYGLVATGVFTNTMTLMSRATHNQQSFARRTTGTGYALNGIYGLPYAVSVMGSNMLNTSNLTGTVSLVQPFLVNQFSRNPGGTFGGNTLHLNGAGRLNITFMPEPARALMLGAAVIGLAGLARLRRMN